MFLYPGGPKVNITAAQPMAVRIRPAEPSPAASSAVIQDTQLQAGAPTRLWITIRDRYNNTVQPDLDLLGVHFRPNASDATLDQASNTERQQVPMELEWVSGRA